MGISVQALGGESLKGFEAAQISNTALAASRAWNLSLFGVALAANSPSSFSALQKHFLNFPPLFRRESILVPWTHLPAVPIHSQTTRFIQSHRDSNHSRSVFLLSKSIENSLFQFSEKGQTSLTVSFSKAFLQNHCAEVIIISYHRNNWLNSSHIQLHLHVNMHHMFTCLWLWCVRFICNHLGSINNMHGPGKIWVINLSKSSIIILFSMISLLKNEMVDLHITLVRVYSVEQRLWSHPFHGQTTLQTSIGEKVKDGRHTTTSTHCQTHIFICTRPLLAWNFIKPQTASNDWELNPGGTYRRTLISQRSHCGFINWGWWRRYKSQWHLQC